MVYKCCIVNCRSNYTGEESTTVFSFRKEEDLKKRWIRFVNQKDWEPTFSSYICIKHFEEKYYKKGKTSKCLAMNVKPVLTIFDPKKVISKNSEINNVTSPICIPWRTPRKRLYQEDQYESFISKDSVKDSKCLNESFSPSVYTFRKNDDHVLFYKLEENEMSIPEVIDYIRIDSELHVQPFFKGAPIYYPNGFSMEEIVVSLAKICFFTVAKGIVFFFILTIT